MRIKNAKMIGVYGARRSGKSTKAKALIRREKRVVVFDALDEYAEEEGYRRFTKLPELGKAMAENYGKGFRFAYVPSSGLEMTALHKLSLMLMHRIQAPYKAGDIDEEITLVVEEMNQCFPVTSLPSELSGFPEICSRGRHYGINVIGVAQRMAEINTRFRGNLAEQYVFRLVFPNDIKAACDLLGREYGTDIKNLEAHHYFKWEEGGEITEGKNKLR